MTMPSLDRHHQFHGVTKRKLHPDCVLRQMQAARQAADAGEEISAEWCALALVTYHDYRDTKETLRINGYARRAA